MALSVHQAPHTTHSASAELELGLWTVVPFVLLLLAIAVLPLVTPHFWARNRNRALVAGLLAVPVACWLLLFGEPGKHALVEALAEYGAFIVLLGSLYTVAGGIRLSGDVQGTPLTNTGFLAFGAVLANIIGTTGASMVLIRPVLRINAERERVRHIPVFFIFLVSNLGGLLTPLGDPPLFIGFLRGLDFFWTLRLWPQWLVANGAVLALFFVWDSLAYRREPKWALFADRVRIEPLRLAGRVNIVFLLGIIAGVLLRAESLSGLDERTGTLAGSAVMVLMAVGSLLATPRGLRAANGFSWHAIIEVAVLFAGIFVTMIPALELLKQNAGAFGTLRAWHYFWLTGGLSSFLDNVPTYLTFGTLAASVEQTGGIAELALRNPRVLEAISCGAVFMGANTYIGNGPNFMVKAIADEAGFRTPSFFGYMLYSGLILLPVFVGVTAIFFVP